MGASLYQPLSTFFFSLVFLYRHNIKRGRKQISTDTVWLKICWLQKKIYARYRQMIINQTQDNEIRNRVLISTHIQKKINTNYYFLSDLKN